MNFGTKTYRRLAERSRERREYEALLRMDDHLLRDIGVTREDVGFQLKQISSLF